MANSLLAHLYSHIRGSQEDIATISLQYVLSQSSALNKCFTQQISQLLKIQIADTLQYTCQSVGEHKERPDLAGNDIYGNEQVLCEMKFYAGLTPNQPLTYLQRLKEGPSGKGLVFICPKVRQTLLWAKLKNLCKDYPLIEINQNCVDVDGIRMGILSWTEILDSLLHTATSSANEYLSDLYQLKGYCDHLDSEAFIPFVSEELSAETARKVQRYYDILQEVGKRICIAEGSIGKVKSSCYQGGYEIKVDARGYSLSLLYDRNLWKSNASIETPFWLSMYDAEMQKQESFQKSLLQIPESKKDNSVWTMCYLALEPLTNATFDEVCDDLKSQVYGYLDIFKADDQ